MIYEAEGLKAEMLSSFTSLLPSALQHINSTPHANLPPEVDDDDDDEEHNGKADEPTTTKKKEKKEKGVNETFIFVRPPPAKSNHPLNLQVHSPTSTTASDTGGAPLSRTESNRSEASTYSSSGYASTASFSSVGSTASGRRMIIPLYNLQAHNVMTNTIVDAGTDAKIAKFTRKGLEMIDLAMVEVVEVWPAPTGIQFPAPTTGTGSARGSLDEGQRLRNRPSTVGNSHLRPQQTSSRPTTPDPDRFTPGSSVVSVSSAGLSAADEHVHAPEIPAAGLPIGLPPQKKNIFGKLFKKKEASPSPPMFPTTSFTPPSPNHSQLKTPTQTAIPPSPTRHGRNLSTTGFGRRGGSASPSRPVTSSGVEGSGLGIRGLMKHVRPSSMHLDPSDVQVHDYAYDYELGRETTNVSTTSSRLSTGSRTNTLEPPPMSTGGNGSSASNATVVLPATLGIQPILSSPGGPAALSAFANFASSGYPPPKSLGFGRGPALYVWVIRKWIKTPEGASSPGLFGGMRNHHGHNSNSNGHSGRGSQPEFIGLAEVEVRVEWKRGKKSKSKKKSKDKAQVGDAEDAESSTSRGVSRSGSQRRRSIVASQSSPMGSNSSLPTSETSQARKRRNRLSTASRASANDDPDTTLTSSLFGRGRSKTDDDDGNDSDPEDSETPWTCMLKVRRLPVAGLPRPSSSISPTPVKTKIATLSPTPHHPKVVAMLKVPYPLPDLEVQTMSVRKRHVGPPGTAPAQTPMIGLVLKAEEIKDVVV
ncbi:hypothetical protein BT96DRAFT_1017948 [Gymnopus androsaceus JB14]|uniref:Uncharacterized protein n=1 Tax=Gymnopus androsaceus JB14 TaxID=1447944 RepID=A0A6A4HVU2_9AGAR|nr:hypothetical protein BT96DRAFT_1017948 [Gymnopus androsaceus JB14]